MSSWLAYLHSFPIGYYIFIVVLCVASAGPADRLRGHAYHLGNRTIDKLLYAVIMTLLYPMTEAVVFFSIVIGLMIGMSFGWGCPMGAILTDTKMQEKDYEWWQFGVLQKDPYKALAFRGLMWGLMIYPVLLIALLIEGIYSLLSIPGVSYLYPFEKILSIFTYPGLLIYAVAYMIAFPLAMKFHRVKMPFEDDPWGKTEWVRGWIAGIIVGVFGITLRILTD